MGVRLFEIHDDGKFREFIQKGFQIEHEEEVLEDWLEANPDKILEDGKLLLIGRQVATNLGTYIDLLGIDRDGNVVVIELKRHKTPRDTLAQALEYASFAEELSSEQLESIYATYLSEGGPTLGASHRECFNLGDEETTVFNQEQRIVIVGQKVTQHVQQTSRFLRKKGIRVTCIEFTFFETETGGKFMSVNPVVGTEVTGTRAVSSGPVKKTTEREFLESLDANGRPVFMRLLDHARQRNYPLNWGSKGFSMNVEIDGVYVPICYGYPPTTSWGQIVGSFMTGMGGLLTKVGDPDGAATKVHALCQEVGFFGARGKDWQLRIDRPLSGQEIENLIGWTDKVAAIAREHGLKGQEME
jgi:hypothetical protein